MKCIREEISGPRKPHSSRAGYLFLLSRRSLVRSKRIPCLPFIWPSPGLISRDTRMVGSSSPPPHGPTPLKFELRTSSFFFFVFRNPHRRRRGGVPPLSLHPVFNWSRGGVWPKAWLIGEKKSS